jgi:hypothetical protein
MGNAYSIGVKRLNFSNEGKKGAGYCAASLAKSNVEASTV